VALNLVMSVCQYIVTLAVLATKIAAVPSRQPLVSRYPCATHTLPLSKSNYFSDPEGTITIGSQTVKGVLDTGSSDLFFIPQDVQCLDVVTLKPTPNNVCEGFFAPKLIHDSSFQQIPNVHLNASYGSNSVLFGPVGYDKVSFAGIDVPKQEIALPTTVAANYIGNVTGIIGLAYPRLTSVFSGENLSVDKRCSATVGANNTGCNQQYVWPLLTTIFADGLTPPVFAFALGCGMSYAGVMTIGGLPDITDPRVNVTKDSLEVTVPIEKFEGVDDYEAYVVTVDAFHRSGAPTGAGKAQYVVDTGTIPTIMNETLINDFIKLFDPPAYYNETLAAYLVGCDATAPDFGVEIGGKIFQHNPKDLILDKAGILPNCQLAIQASLAKGTVNILGNLFLKSVLAVFDVGKEQMTFASRLYYEE
jgi:hypothetical protein